MANRTALAKRTLSWLQIFCVFVLLNGFAVASDDPPKTKVDANTIGALTARPIGPAAMSGRIAALDVVNSNPRVIYVGAAGGGVWKSTDAGLNFRPVFDKHTQSVGAVRIDQSNPETVWVGTGEGWTRNSVSVGSGVYKSTDGGDNWTLMGLENSERIGKIVLDPKDSNIAYVAVVGALWSASEHRGLYKTTDGGKTWEKILYVSPDAGCADVALDPKNPSVVYAAMWQFRRQPWSFSSGGPGSGLHKSADGGKTWKKLSNGLPDGELGRIALAVAPSQPNVVYANVESKRTALYASADMGESWTMVNDANPNVKARPFYFGVLVVDPKDHLRVFKPAESLSFSKDGGKTFATVGAGVHSDHHALWVDPSNTAHLLLGTDGGVYESHDGGQRWRFLRGLPVSQFYHVTTDNASPYNVYGGLQDNGTWTAPSQKSGGIANADWKNIGGGDGFWTFPDPTDKNIVYVESQGAVFFFRRHRDTGEVKSITPTAQAGEPKLRFNWNTPLLPGRKNPKNIYLGAQYVFRSTDRGESWTRISPDLTTNNPQKQKQAESGGLTLDNSTAENHCTVFTINESPLDDKIVWAGTDDGNLQVTRDGGKTWSNVVANIPGLPSNTWCSSVTAGAFAPGTAYATFDGHQTGDMKPYVFKTEDFGKTWRALATDDVKGYAHVIREDLVNPNLLFLGTEFGLFVSVDGGAQWAKFTGGLPSVAVRDLCIQARESDLVIATHGRGIYIVDDISPLRQLTPQTLESPVAFFETRPAFIREPDSEQSFPGSDEYVGDTPNEVAFITYYLKERHLIGDFKIEIYDAADKLVATLPGGRRKGINRVEWAFRLKPPKVPIPEGSGLIVTGPTVPEGTYTVKLLKGKDSYVGKVSLVADPRLPHSAEERRLKQQTQMKLYAMLERLGYVDGATADALSQVRERAKGLEGDPAAASLRALGDRLDALRKTLSSSKQGNVFLTGDFQLNERLAFLYVFVSGYGGRPTTSQMTQVAIFERELEQAQARLESLFATEVAGVNAALAEKKLEPVKLLSREEYDKRQTKR